MERTYYRRDEQIVVEEISDVRAVHVAVDKRGALRAAEGSFGTSAVETVRSNIGPEFSEEALAAFEQANWRFVQPSTELTRALRAEESVRDAEEVGKVIQRQDGTVAIVTNHLSVQLAPELTEEECEALLREKRLEVLTRLRFAPNLYEVVGLGREDALETSVELHEDARFILAEPTFIEHIPPRLAPTDPRYRDQWQWNNTGQSGGTVGADVHAEEAWDITLGRGIRVAVIDNGFDADHEDLAAGVSSLSGFFSASGGGAATFTQGTAGMPDANHGTFCAGMVGARKNGAQGGSGAAPECELMLIAALGDQVGTQTTLARAVGYAADPSTESTTATADDGADILVSSLGPNGAVWNLTVVLELALEAAAANGRNGRGLAVFWAASNGNNVNVTLDQVVSHEDVIAVVRSDNNDLEDNAARGATVELIAPGVNVLSTNSGDGYGFDTGTSYAAPCAAGCAALALSMNPGLTRDQLRQIMRDTADKIGGVVYDANGHNNDYGFGRVNAYQAVLNAAASIPCLPQSGMHSIQQKSNGRYLDAYQSSSKDFSVVTRTAQNNDTQRWALTTLGGVYTIQQLSNGRYLDAHESSSKDFSLVTRTVQNNDTQRWVLIPEGNNTYTVQQLSKGRFMDAHESGSNDFSVVTRIKQNNDTQRWVINPLGVKVSALPYSGIYIIQQKSNGRFMDAHESGSNDFSVVTRTEQNNDTQRWILTPVAGLFAIRQKSKGRFMDAHESSSKDFSLVTRTVQNNDTQRWVLTPEGNNTYTVQQLSKGRFMDAHESSSKDFSVVTRTVQNNDTQRWLINPLGITIPCLPQSGMYSIQQKSNGRYLDAHESSSKDFSLVTRTAQNNDTQRWALTTLGGVYTIQQLSNGRYLDAHESSSKDFSLVTRTVQNNDTQRWVLIPEGNNTYTVQQLSKGRFMDAHESSSKDFSVVTRTVQNNDTQRWVLTADGSNTYTIQQKSNGRYLDAHESSSKDFSVVTRNEQNNDTQRWILTPVAGLYTIYQKSNGRFMDAHESSSKDFSVVTRASQNNDTQRWVLTPEGNNIYTVQQLSKGRFMDAHESSSKDFSVVTRTKQNNDTQRWLINSL